MAKWSNKSGRFERPLGDSEFAFFPSSQDALGDMFLHLALSAPIGSFSRDRVHLAWALIRRQNPLLMCQVLMDGDDLTSAHFSLQPPITSEAALQDASAAVFFTDKHKDDIISQYMDGERVLSNQFLSYVKISKQASNETEEIAEFDLFMCAPHFIGDGTALHQSTHELLCILTCNKSDIDLRAQLDLPYDWEKALPPAVETRLCGHKSAIGKAASKVNFLKTLGKEVGGHTFCRTRRGPKRTVLKEFAFTESQTNTLLAHCKANKVTVNHAFSAVCNVAWGRCTVQSIQLPMMMYTAANLRSYLSPHTASTDWYLALTYFNIVLPSFLPASPAVFWHRARQARAQTHMTINSPFFVSRALQMARTRASRARGLPPPSPPVEPIVSPAPSAALLGLSLIGNLDRIYVRASYPTSVKLHSVATASRLKPGGMLLLEHTFERKLWLNLCWDEMGFEEGQVERFWDELKAAVVEFLC